MIKDIAQGSISVSGNIITITLPPGVEWDKPGLKISVRVYDPILHTYISVPFAYTYPGP
jgi:hypothetical protein